MRGIAEPDPDLELVEALAVENILAGVPYARLDPGAGFDDVLLVCATETTAPEDIETLASALTRRFMR